MESSSFRVSPGSVDCGLLLHIPHASTFIPETERALLLLDDAALKAELTAMTDASTDALAEAAAALVTAATGRRPWLFVNSTSRLVVDPERFPDDREEMESVGMGAVYTRTSNGGPLRSPTSTDRHRLLDTYFHPYSQALSSLVDERLSRLGEVTIVDMHSYPTQALPYELHQDLRRPEVCLGVDAFHTSSALISSATAAFSSIGACLVNEPFIGTYVPLEHYCKTPAVQSIMVELRRDTYLESDRGFELTAAALGSFCAEFA